MPDRLDIMMQVIATAKGFAGVAADVNKLADAGKGIEDSFNRSIKVFSAHEQAMSRMGNTASILAQKYRALESRQLALSRAALGVGAAFGGIAVTAGSFIKSTVQLASRVETLGVVTVQLGRNVGKTEEQIRGLEQAIQAQGITTQASRQAIALMIQAQVDLAHATDLARIAQDAAVIANTDSSDAFQKLVLSISTANVVQLRTLGMAVTFDAAYKKMAEGLGVNVDQLNEMQKAQARTNAVIEAGKQIAGTYTAAMETAGKKTGSMARLTEELQLAMGKGGLLTAYTDLIDVIYKNLQAFNDLEDAQKNMVGTGIGLTTMIAGLSAVVLIGISALMKLRAAMTAFSVATGITAISVAALTAIIVALSAGIVLIGYAIYNVNKKQADFQANILAAGKSVQTTSGNYTQYRASIDKVLQGTDYWIDANGNLMKTFKLHGEVYERVIEQNFVYAESQYAIAQGAADADKAMLGTAARMGLVTEATEEAIGVGHEFFQKLTGKEWEALTRMDVVLPLRFSIDPSVSDISLRGVAEKMIADIDFMLAGGGKLTQIFDEINKSMVMGMISPEQGRLLLESFIGLYDDVAAVAAGEMEAVPGLLDLSQIDFDDAKTLEMFKAAGAAGAETYATTFTEKLKESIDFESLMKELASAEAITAGTFYGPEIPGVEEAEEMGGTEEALDNLGIASETAGTLYGGFSDNVGESVGVLHAAELKARALVKQQDLLTDKTVLWTILIEVQGGIPSLGGGYSPTFEGLGGQFGANFVVPPGFPNDTFPMRVTSGEHVQVTPAGGTGPPGMSSGDQFNISFPGAAFATDLDVEDAAVRILEFVQEAKG